MASPLVRRLPAAGSRADAIVVLGRGVDPDGALPKLARQRVDRAAELYAWEVAPRLIFSGRCSLMTNEIPEISEAESMRQYALEIGLPADRLFVEEISRDTIGNAWFVLKQFLEPNDWMSIRVVTSDFHIQRTSWIFQKVLGLGYDVSYSPAASELHHSTIAARAREESDISAFLMEWLGSIHDGDAEALERLIHESHPGYSAQPTVSREDIMRRVTEMGRAHRVDDGSPRGHRVRQSRLVDL